MHGLIPDAGVLASKRTRHQNSPQIKRSCEAAGWQCLPIYIIPTRPHFLFLLIFLGAGTRIPTLSYRFTLFLVHTTAGLLYILSRHHWVLTITAFFSSYIHLQLFIITNRSSHRTSQILLETSSITRRGIGDVHTQDSILPATSVQWCLQCLRKTTPARFPLDDEKLRDEAATGAQCPLPTQHP